LLQKEIAVMTRHLIITAAVLALAACANSGETAPADEGRGMYDSIPAPTRADIATHITKADDGKTVSVKAGTKIAVELVGVPTAGYAWAVKEQPAFLFKIGETGGPTSEAQLQPGFAGGNHWEVFFFEVSNAGEGLLKLEQRQMWDEAGPAADTFSVTIRAN
jgi:predicted secreted protein